MLSFLVTGCGLSNEKAKSDCFVWRKGKHWVCKNVPSIVNAATPLITKNNEVFFWDFYSDNAACLRLGEKLSLKNVPPPLFAKKRKGGSGVIVLEGGNEDAFLPSAISNELFWPLIGRKLPVDYPSMVRISNDEILIFGGVPKKGNNLSEKSQATRLAWVYNINNDKLIQLPSKLAFTRVNPTVSFLDENHVLISGGNLGNYRGLVTGQSEIFSVTEKKFSVTKSMNVPRVGHSAIRLPNGNVLILGGQNNKGAVLEVELYDFDTKKYYSKGPMPASQLQVMPILLKNGKILLVGGENESGLSAELMEYEPLSNQFRHLGELYDNRVAPNLTLLKNGLVLVTNGRCDYNNSGYTTLCSTLEVIAP